MATEAKPSTNPQRDLGQVQVISRAARILRAIRDADGLNLAQLAAKVRLPRTTVYRIVTTLEAEGLLTTVDPGGQIELGVELISLGGAVRHDLRRELRPFLEELSLKVDETVDLSIRDKDHILFLDQVTRLQRLRAVSGIGMTFPLHCTANGKALLATLSTEAVMQLLPEDLPAFTPTTIRTRVQLIEELAAIRLSGIAYDREEHSPGISAVAAAIEAPLSTTLAISIPVPTVRFLGQEERFASALLQTCDVVGQRTPGVRRFQTSGAAARA